MDLLSYDFGIDTIRFVSGNHLSSDTWEDIDNRISEIVSLFDRLFSMDSFTSEVYKFNTLPLGVPLTVSAEFVNLLLLCQDISNRYPHMTMLWDPKLASHSFSREGNDLVKNTEVKFKPFIAKFVLLEEIHRELKSQHIENYCLQLKQNYLTDGIWQLRFTNPVNDTPFEIEIENARAVAGTTFTFTGDKVQHTTDFTNPFSKHGGEADVAGVVINSNSMVESYIFSQNLLSLRNQVELKFQAKKLPQTTHVWMCSADGDVVQL